MYGGARGRSHHRVSDRVNDLFNLVSGSARGSSHHRVSDRVSDSFIGECMVVRVVALIIE